MWLAQPLLRRKLRLRGKKEPGYLVAVPERFGHYTQPAQQGAIWIHAVSLGETRAAAILLARLREAMPGMRLLLTHGTATGREEGAKLLEPGDVQVWQPWDMPGAVRRFIEHFRPRIGLLMETEVWPNLVAHCARQGIPLALANARLNEKSLAQAQRLIVLAGPAFSQLAAVWAQTAADAERLERLGAPVKGVFGNLKFDSTPDAAQLARGKAWAEVTRADGSPAQPVVMFASSREGEEPLFLDALAALRERTPDAAARVQWLIVPRHPQRFGEVAALIESRGFSLSRRSSWTDAPEPADVWLGDSLGEMALYYALSGAALLGGSFLPLGGQNLIEAAACGCPVVMGPHTFNFAEAAELAEASGAALRVTDIAAGVARAFELVLDDDARQRQSALAIGFASAHRGAAEKTAQAARALAASASRPA